jgi:hypothetical protein
MMLAMKDIQRPDVEVYARHSSKCTYRGTAKRPEDGRCRCRKWLYVRGTWERITADTRSWETARTKAREYGDQHDPAKIAERTAGKADRLHAFVGIMRSAGLSILDTTIQEPTRLAVDDRLELYRHKTENPCTCRLSPNSQMSCAALRRFLAMILATFSGAGMAARSMLPIYGARHCDGPGQWSNPLWTLQDRYGHPLRPSSHFFRNTFAKEMVETCKVSIDQLATLLGDNPATVREHYFKWVPDLQVALDAAVRARWKMRMQDIERADSCPTCGRPVGECKEAADRRAGSTSVNPPENYAKSRKINL